MTDRIQKIEAVILDWAGTTIDHGSLLPAQVFVEVFHRYEIEITIQEARGPMGRGKRDHIVQIASLPRIKVLWKERHGRDIQNSDIDAMYDAFVPIQKHELAKRTEVIPGIPEAVTELRSRGIKIGSTTGYTRELMDVVIPIALRQGYSADTVVCADDVWMGRPAPWMNFLAAQQINVYPMHRILVVDDTPVGIEAGLNAGAITVAVTRTGNSLGMSESEISQLSKTELESRLTEIEIQFRSIGTHFTIGDVTQLPELVMRISGE